MTDSFDPTAIRRPDPQLRNYYLVLSVFGGLLPALPLFAKYLTLQYQFDESGVSMKWGILFRHEIHLTYRRIQDIHLTRNLLQRWLGLATVSIQTASGSSAPEMKIEGILAAEALRDYLYSKMRGSRGLDGESSVPSTAIETAQVTSLLLDIRNALDRIARGESPAPPAAIPEVAPQITTTVPMLEPPISEASRGTINEIDSTPSVTIEAESSSDGEAAAAEQVSRVPEPHIGTSAPTDEIPEAACVSETERSSS